MSFWEDARDLLCSARFEMLIRKRTQGRPKFSHPMNFEPISLQGFLI
jgi:hypothetical protein